MVSLVVVWCSNRCAALTLATVLGEVGDDAIHMGKLSAVDQIASVTNGLNQTGVAQFFQVK